MGYRITNQKDLRRQFWTDNPTLDRKRIPDHAGIGRMHVADTRCAFCDWVDAMRASGIISEALAHRATLD